MYLGYNLQFLPYQLQVKFWSFPFLLRLAALISIALILVLIINKLRSLFNNWKLHVVETEDLSLKEKIETLVNALLFESTNRSEKYILNEIESLYAIKESRRGLKIISKLLIQANSKSRLGEYILNNNNYKHILSGFGIIKFWELELVSNNTSRIHKAEQCLNDLKIEETNSLTKLSKSEEQKKTMARSSKFINKVEGNEPYRFLDESFDTEFTPLDEILVHQFLLQKSNTGRIPLLSRWVRNSKNPDFRIFMVKEIAFFKQLGCASIIASLLPNEPNDNVRLAIIDALTKLNYAQAESQITSCYKNGSLQLKRSIVQTVILFKTRFGLEFLNEFFFEEKNEELKTDLIQALILMRSDINGESEKPINDNHEVNEILLGNINYQIG